MGKLNCKEQGQVKGFCGALLGILTVLDKNCILDWTDAWQACRLGKSDFGCSKAFCAKPFVTSMPLCSSSSAVLLLADLARARWQVPKSHRTQTSETTSEKILRKATST